MLTFKGKNVNNKTAVGAAVIVDEFNNAVKEKTSDSDNELLRFFTAKEKAEGELLKLEKAATEKIGEEEAQIFSIHRMLMEDEDYNSAVTDYIMENNTNAEYAVMAAGEKFARIFEAVEDDYISRRAEDMRDISKRIISCMASAKNQITPFKGKGIICARELSCGDAVMLDKNNVVAVVTEKGSKNSHTSIILKGMGIMYVAGVGDGFVSALSEGDTILVDSDGNVYVNPDGELLASAMENLKKNELTDGKFRGVKVEKLTAEDGRVIEVCANINRMSDLVQAKEYGCGFGLVRSELLFDESDAFTDEEKQFDVYKKVIEAADGQRVVIRTFDFGSDKSFGGFSAEREENPALGNKGIRLCLANRELFKCQLRAILRAAKGTDTSVMFPMLVSVNELLKAIECVKEAEKELESKGIEYAKGIRKGMMIETPAAALTADLFAPLVDFFSVGTNDLMQYTLACDRTNPIFDGLYASEYEAVMRLVEKAAFYAKQRGIHIGICGGLAADVTLTGRFIAMGIDSFSVPPSDVGEIIKSVLGSIAND